MVVNPAPQDLSMIIFGASGDLCRRKLMPALYHLYESNLLPENFSVLGFGRSAFSKEAFAERMRELYKYGSKVEKFFSHVEYLQGEYENVESYRRLDETLKKCPPNRLFYLAVPPEQMRIICQRVGEIGCKDCTVFPRTCEDCPREKGGRALF